MYNNLATMLSAKAGGVLAYQARGFDQLMWVDREGNPKEKVGPPMELGNFRLSSDQTKVAFDFDRVVQGEVSKEIAVYDFKRELRESITLSGKSSFVPVFSPDSNQIAFTSRRTGRFNPYIVSSSNQERQVTDMGLNGGYPVDWSPDGKYLLYWGDEDLWIVPLAAGEKPYPFARTAFEERAGAFSPDGHWIAYASNESGRYEVYLQAFPEQSRKRYTVSGQGGTSPSWRRDGKELFYVAGDGRLTSVPLTILGTEVKFGAATSLFPVSASDFHRAYEPSLDGQRFLIAVPADGTPRITVTMNWTQLLSD
jgi:Tol biopolymer transport system component